MVGAGRSGGGSTREGRLGGGGGGGGGVGGGVAGLFRERVKCAYKQRNSPPLL